MHKLLDSLASLDPLLKNLPYLFEMQVSQDGQSIRLVLHSPSHHPHYLRVAPAPAAAADEPLAAAAAVGGGDLVVVVALLPP